MSFLLLLIFSGSFIQEYNKTCICLLGSMLRVIIIWGWVYWGPGGACWF